MSAIEILDHHVVYDNPIPQVRSRHGYFPGLAVLPSGDLLALFMMSEALDAANATTMVSRSKNQGATWTLEGSLHRKSPEHVHDSDYLKPLVLGDGSLIATGYRFHRTDPDQTLANPKTDGMRDGENLVSFSQNEGRTWAHPEVIARTCPELIEASGPAILTRSGSILTGGSLFPMWDGSHPTGFVGVLLRSGDGGRTWDDSGRFFRDPNGRYMPSEPRFCEMQEGRLVSLVWTTDHAGGKNITNHVTVSHDDGAAWSDPIDTGVWGQASNLIHLGGDTLLTIHSHRDGSVGEVGLFVRIVDLAGDRWRIVEECKIWGNAPSADIGSYAEMAKRLKFGQPSLLSVENGVVLATHWAVEDGQGRILTHRLRIAP